ncbi:MAG: hypothetical protein ABSA81_03740 [Candidatus Bathyarchaeia archaeon]
MSRREGEELDRGWKRAGPVGGVVMPTNMLAVLAPWLVVIATVGCIGTVVVVARKRRQ